MIRLYKIGGKVVDDPAALERFCAEFAALDGPKLLVHGGGIVPGVAVVKVLVPGLQVAVAEGDVLLLEIVLGDEGLHPAVQLLGVEDAVAPHLADLLGVFGSDLHRAVTLGHVRLIRVGGQGCRRKERKRQQQAQDRFSRSAQFHFHVASHPRGARTLL